VVRLVYRLDGTLIRTNGAGVKAFERTFADEFGFPMRSAELPSGRTDTSLVRQFFRATPLKIGGELRRFFNTTFHAAHLLPQTGGAACSV